MFLRDSHEEQSIALRKLKGRAPFSRMWEANLKSQESPPDGTNVLRN